MSILPSLYTSKVKTKILEQRLDTLLATITKAELVKWNIL